MNGKAVLTEAPLLFPACLLPSQHLALASTSVSTQGRLLSSVCLPSALPSTWLRPCLSESMNIMLLMEKLIKPSYLVIHLTTLESKGWIVGLRCLHNCLISAEYNRVTKCLEWRFTTFIDLDFKPLVCF